VAPISTEEWRAQGRLTTLCGYEIFYADTAEVGKPAVFLIHGFPTSSWDWAPIWSELRATHRLIALDLLGFGWSDKPNPHTYSIMEQADLCEALVRELGLETFDVLAHDYGDTVAQELLARQNDGTGAGKWLSLCLLNGGLFPETHRPRLIQRLLLSPIGPLVNKLVSKRSFDSSFSAVFGRDTKPGPEELESFWRLILHKNGKEIFYRLITYITDRKRHRERWVGALQNSVVPLGLINGSVDPVSGAHMVARYLRVIGADHFIVELPCVGHYPQIEAPGEVVGAYRSFLSSLRS